MAWLYHTYAAWQRKSFRLGHAINTGQVGAQQLARLHAALHLGNFPQVQVVSLRSFYSTFPSAREFQRNCVRLESLT